MVYTKEYRICMPLTLEEYRIGQLYMVARHSREQTDAREGVEVVENIACKDPVHGNGQYTEKRLHLSSRLPYWIQSLTPRLFYLTEKAWNYYPYSVAEYTSNLAPWFHISVRTKYEDNNGSNENCLDLSPEELSERTVDHIDIAYDEVSARHYKEEEDVRYFQSQQTGRGPLIEGWRDTTSPIMCSYKLVKVSFAVWGLQRRAEEMLHKLIREILLLGHRQAFAWIDEWYAMTLNDARTYEDEMQKETNSIVAGSAVKNETTSCDEEATLQETGDEGVEDSTVANALPPSSGNTVALSSGSASPVAGTPISPQSPKSPKSWYSWSLFNHT